MKEKRKYWDSDATDEEETEDEERKVENGSATATVSTAQQLMH